MQHNNHKKESFKLLQLSDDSKSLSELELPQVNTVHPQRKRKILRKTRNTSPHSARLAATAASHHHNGVHAHDAATGPDGLLQSACSANFGLWIAVVMTCGWLFILSYMTAVVYSENRRLEAQLFKLSAGQQTVPDELQRWHESARWLEQNQTAMLQRLGDADGRALALAKDVRALHVEFKEKYDDSSDHEKVSRLQNNVAQFGAQLKDLNIDVSALKERTAALRSGADSDAAALRALSAFVHDANGTRTAAAGSDATGSGAGPLSNATVLWLVHNVTDATRTQLHQLAVDLDALKYAQAQRAQGVEDDVRAHRRRLDALGEAVANVTAHVQSIESSLRMATATPLSAASSAPQRVIAEAEAKPTVAAASPAAAPVVVMGDRPTAPTAVDTSSTTTTDPLLVQVLSGASNEQPATGAGRR